MDYQPYAANAPPYHYAFTHPLEGGHAFRQPDSPASSQLQLMSPTESHEWQPAFQVCEEMSHPERGIAGFVSKLYQSLQAPDDGQKYAHWCQHNGTDMFIIDCIPKFTEIVLPRLFKHCKFASFVRQLNIYGFQRDTDARKSKDSRDKETCRWYHPFFRPGRRDLFHLIRRKTPRYSRRKRSKATSDPETILNVGSGDESDNDDQSKTTDSRRRSSSSIASTVTATGIMSASPTAAVTTPLSTPTSTPPTTSLAPSVTNVPTAPLMIHDHGHSQQQQQQQLQQHQHQLQHQLQLHPPQHAPQAQSHQQQTQEMQIACDARQEGREMEHMQPLHDQVVTMERDQVLLQQQTAHKLFAPDNGMKHDSAVMQEEELQAELAQLKRNYDKVHQFYIAQLSKAQSQIDVQTMRIEQLESALRLMRMASRQPFPNQPQATYNGNGNASDYMSPFVGPYMNPHVQVSSNPQRELCGNLPAHSVGKATTTMSVKYDHRRSSPGMPTAPPYEFLFSPTTADGVKSEIQSPTSEVMDTNNNAATVDQAWIPSFSPTSAESPVDSTVPLSSPAAYGMPSASVKYAQLGYSLGHPPMTHLGDSSSAKSSDLLDISLHGSMQ